MVRVASALLLLCSLVPRVPAVEPAASGDWPQWRGPSRDGKSAEKGLLAQWPEGGPRLLWSMKGLGTGYASISIVGGRIFTLGDRDGGEWVLAFDLGSRKELWATRIGDGWGDGGPRCTPTVSGGRAYALTPHGDLACLDAATGKAIWSKHLRKDFGGDMMSGWGYSESPLVDGSRLVCTPGGKDAALVALDAATGSTVWKASIPGLGDRGKNGAAYSSPIVCEIQGTRQYVQLLGRGVVGIEAESGKFLWGYNRIANDVASIPTPVVRGNHVFCSTAYGTGSALLEIVKEGGSFTAKEIYFLDADTFQNHHGGVVLVGDHVYGGHGQNAGEPKCIELLTGKIAWESKAPRGGKSASVVYADGRVYFHYEGGQVRLVEATPAGFQLKGEFRLPEKDDAPHWAHPVILDGKLYLRYKDTLHCYDIKA